MATKLTKGRQKIPMVKIQNETNLQVTFSKRRNGLFKKANELCTLTGAKVALIVFSPAGRVYSFGHPCVRSISNKYLEEIAPPSNGIDDHVIDSHHIENICDLNNKITHLGNILEAEKRREEVLDQMKKDGQSKYWWHARIDELNLQQLEMLKKALEGLKKNVDNESHKRASISHYLFEKDVLGREIGPTNAMDVPVARAFGPSGFSSFVSMDIASPALIDLNSRPSGFSSSEITDGFEPRIHKLF